jgi:hypothetical protein
VLKHVWEDRRELELNAEGIIPALVVQDVVKPTLNLDRHLAQFNHITKAQSKRDRRQVISPYALNDIQIIGIHLPQIEGELREMRGNISPCFCSMEKWLHGRSKVAFTGITVQPDSCNATLKSG